MKIKVGLIGFGRMGRFYLKEMQKSGRWDVAYICDINPDCRELAKQLSPESKILENEQEMFDDESVQVVGLFALADSRLDRIEKAIKYGKHIISEKPVSDTIDKEWKVVDITEKASCFSTVNFIPKGGILSTALNILSVACAAMLIFLTNPYKIKQRRDV